MFGTGQPTKEGFKLVLDFISKETGANGILWTNMRQVEQLLTLIRLALFFTVFLVCTNVENKYSAINFYE